jgi:ABC-type multidrug transport system fused ATPase/permease subunit
MDEPLTGVDAFTFRDVSLPLRTFLERDDKTIVLISHRLSFVAFADHVVVLGEGGRVIEAGRRDVLIERGGDFAQLYLTAAQELLPHLSSDDLRLRVDG